MPGPGVFPGMDGGGKRRGEGLVVGEGFIPPVVFAATGGFRGVGNAAPYVSGCPLTGGCANLRRGVGTPPYGCNSRKHCRGGIYAARGFPGDGRFSTSMQACCGIWTIDKQWRCVLSVNRLHLCF